VLDVPAGRVPGAGQVVIRADAGGGRATIVPVDFAVSAPHASAAPPLRLAAVDRLVGAPATDRALELVAVALLGAVAALLVRTRRQLH
jgi:hypothetical protein